eukprot:10795628-Alexandrium_andersonii.AAC.1
MSPGQGGGASLSHVPAASVHRGSQGRFRFGRLLATCRRGGRGGKPGVGVSAARLRVATTRCAVVVVAIVAALAIVAFAQACPGRRAISEACPAA